MGEYLPDELHSLLTEGVTPLGTWDTLTDQEKAASRIVRVKPRGSATGQWVGTYSQRDAQTVAERIAAAIPGATVRLRNGTTYVVILPEPGGEPAMTPAEFLSLLEATGHAAEEDAARALHVSKSTIQKLKSGAVPVLEKTASPLRALQDDYADARDAALAAAPELLEVWRSGKNRAGVDENDLSWEATGRPARWHRMIAAECAQEHGTRIVYGD